MFLMIMYTRYSYDGHHLSLTTKVIFPARQNGSCLLFSCHFWLISLISHNHLGLCPKCDLTKVINTFSCKINKYNTAGQTVNQHYIDWPCIVGIEIFLIQQNILQKCNHFWIHLILLLSYLCAVCSASVHIVVRLCQVSCPGSF